MYIDHQPAAAETVRGAAQKRGSNQEDKCVPGSGGSQGDSLKLLSKIYVCFPVVSTIFL